MVHQAVEHIGRLMGRGRDEPDVIGAVLIRDVGVEAETGIDAVAGVDLTRRVSPLAGTEELPVR